MESPAIRRALISVSDKTGLTELARSLVAAGIRIHSTGGTRRHLESDGVPVEDVSAYTGFPEMMDGRLKTLHPKIFGGILCRHDVPSDMRGLAEHGSHPFELVVVNLYPFASTIARADVTWDEAVEQIDIGGPSLVRAAAKNHKFVTIATSPEQYATVVAEITERGATSVASRRRLAAEAFEHTAAYDRVIADYFASREDAGTGSEKGTGTQTGTGPETATWPETIRLTLKRRSELRYGENPHQRAAVYRPEGGSSGGVIAARQLHGKELSYNNLLDLGSALHIARSFRSPAAVVIKHNNPCGLAEGDSAAEAVRKALDGDPVSAFGGILGFNRPVDDDAAGILCEPGLFVEAIVAPEFGPAAIELLTTKPKWKSNVRLLETGELVALRRETRELRFVEGGVLAQDADVEEDQEEQWRVVTGARPDDATMADLRFAWKAVRHVKSNAIVLCKNRMLCGAGAGQMSRVDAVDIAIRKAGSRAAGCVLASDAFFPFPDSIQIAADAGATAVIQPGGSKRDDEVIAACDQRGLPMVCTGRRHFKH